jgi:RNA polymerase sigma-70 factor (ECF subfamily)
MSGAGAALRETVIIAESEANATSTMIEQLVRDHAKTIFRVAYSVLRNHADAEDVAQETFIRVMKFGRLHRIENHKAWLVKIAWRLAVDRAKHVPAEPLDSVIEQLRSSEGVLEEAINRQQRSELMRRLLDTLPADLREVVVLSTIGEMTSADVASAMKIPEGSVRTRMMRARQMLKLKLAAMLEKKR